jgi:MFS family permease
MSGDGGREGGQCRARRASTGECSVLRGLDALSERPFRFLYLARAASVFGDGLLPVALAFGVLQTDNSATALGAVLAFRFASLAGVMPLSGVIADRVPRRLVLMCSDGLRVAVQAATGALLITRAAAVWELAALTFAYGVGDAFFLPTSTGLVPQTISPGRLQQGNALIATTQSACTVIGPAIAGAVVVAAGPGWLFVIDALTFAVSAAFVSRLPVPPAAGSERSTARAPAHPSFVTEMKAGWEEFYRRKWLRIEVVYGGLAAFAVLGPFETLGPVIAKDALGGPVAWSAIMAAFGAGSVLGGLLLIRASPSRPLAAAVVMLSLIALAPAALAGPAPGALAACGALAAGTGLAYYNTLIETTMQRTVEPGVLSRLASIDWMLSNCLFPAGMAIAGPAAALIGTRGVFAAAAAWMILSSGAVLGMRSIRTFQIATPKGGTVPRAEPGQAAGQDHASRS